MSMNLEDLKYWLYFQYMLVSWGIFALQNRLKVKSLQCYLKSKTQNSPLEDSLFF